MGKGSIAMAAFGAAFSAMGYAFYEQLKLEADKTMKAYKLDVTPRYDWTQKLLNVAIGAPYGIVSEGHVVVRPGSVATFNVDTPSTFYPNQKDRLSPVTDFLAVCTRVARIFNQEAKCVDFLTQATYAWQKEEREKYEFGHVSHLKKKPEHPSNNCVDYFAEAMAVALAHGMLIPFIYEEGPRYSREGVAENEGMGISYNCARPENIITPWGSLTSKERAESVDEALQKEVVKTKNDEHYNFYSITQGPLGRKIEPIKLNPNGQKYLNWREIRDPALARLNEKLKEKFKDGTKV